MQKYANSTVVKERGNSHTAKRIAIYVIYDKDGLLDGFRKYYLQELRKVTDHILAVVSGTLTPESRDELEELVDEILVRDNKGLLAGAWLDGIAHIGWNKLYKYDELLMLNDSFFGPFYPLKEMFDKMEESNADFYGAFQNFEDKNITEAWGKPLRHGHFRGSIGYFYIIKRRLLHSPEFRKYWSQSPKVDSDYDTYFFSEIDFYDYVKDAGFRIDSYETNKLQHYFFDNITHNMYRLIAEERVPFARMRGFYSTDVTENKLTVSYGEDPRKTMDFVDKNTDYDVNLIWDYLLRTKNLTQIYRQLQLQYIVNDRVLERPYTYEKKIGAIVHLYHEDLVEEMADYCKNFPRNTDFYVSTTDEDCKKKIEEEFEKRNLAFKCTIRPNVGLATPTLWVTYADVVLSGEYEYICYFHDKKSPYTEYEIHGSQYAERCNRNLYGTSECVKNIINLLEDNPRLGVLGSAIPYHGFYFAFAQKSWSLNYQATIELAKKLNLKVNIDEHIPPVAPYGDMFWFRSSALKKAIGKKLTYKDFDEPAEEKTPEGIFQHGFERIYGFCAQDAGYYFADVVNSDMARTDLCNYKFMIDSLCSAVMGNGHYIASFSHFKDTLTKCTMPPPTALQTEHAEKSISSRRKKFKNFLKFFIPAGIWEKMRNRYHKKGGGKWQG